MIREFIKYSKALFLIVLIIMLAACGRNKVETLSTGSNNSIDDNKSSQLVKGGEYYNLDQVVSYIEKFGSLPSNYITKKEAINKGWNSSSGNLWKVTDKKVIGGDFFGNREGLLPKKSGRKYYEADINYNGGRRGPERLIFSNDGLIYYTKDHYRTFNKLR